MTTSTAPAQAAANTAVADSLPTVTILLLNYNGRAHLPTNLGALEALNYPSGKIDVLLIDNNSSDDSVAWVQANHPRVSLLQTGKNLGFAGGNNAGAKAATGDWLAILNPDTRVHPNWLRELVAVAQQNPEATCIAAKMLNWEGTRLDFADAAINFMGWGNQPGWNSPNLTAYDSVRPLLFACGGAMLVHRTTFLDAGGFDSDYFAYFEDVDFGWRLWLYGQRILFAPRAIVYHRHHGSWEHVAAAKKWRLAERNTLLTLLKNYDDDSLARILPGALLLLLQRAYLDARPNPAQWGLPTRLPAVIYLYYVYSTVTMIDHGRFQELRQLAKKYLRRLFRSQPQTPPPPTEALPPDGTLPTLALSRLLAARDINQQWDQTLAKRQIVQQQRVQPDTDIFPLFQTPLVSNFGDMAFIYAMTHVAIRFKLTWLFGGKSLPLLTAETRKLSMAVSRRLLQHMDNAFSRSSASADDFDLAGGKPPTHYAVPDTAVSLLAHAHHWLWTLPRGDLKAQLHHLQSCLDTWEADHCG